MNRTDYPMAFTGKRVLVFWTQKAYDSGSEWPAFVVIDENEEGIWCAGTKSPSGMDHDGTKTFINFKETYNIIEWKEDK